MKDNEIRLFKELCKFKSNTLDNSLVDNASPTVLGYLFYNRMQGIAYGKLKDCGMLGRVNREFRNSLSAAFEQNTIKNSSFLCCVEMVAQILFECKCKAAMLKGAYLCAHYPIGYRTSNDIDLLVHPNDVSTVGNLLLSAGFKQGSIRNGDFVPATRLEIIESKMLRGETVPYIKEVKLPYMKYLEVDINFSLDYKSGNNHIVTELLNHSCIRDIGFCIPTLNSEDFFIHLCAHLYKEATTLPWIKMHRDMTLYKYCDIYLLLSEMTHADIDSLFYRAQKFGLEKICSYAICETADLFDIGESYALFKSNEVLKDDPNYRLRVISPADKTQLIYQTTDAFTRFFMEDRASDLKECSTDETT